MKQIGISARLRPFSHTPGASCLIPCSSWQVQAFPTLLRFTNLITAETHELPLNIKGPMLDFTLELDLEKRGVHVFGHSKSGYERFCIGMTDEGIRIMSEKGKTKKVIPTKVNLSQISKERLSLGSHKALDWDLVKRKRDLSQVFPVWFRLGQMVPEIPLKKEGTATLLKSCDKLEVVPQFLKLFMAGFHGILIPRLNDDEHQGIIQSDAKVSGCPLGLLTEGAKQIRALFFTEEKDGFAFLPCLPPEFHAGRFLNLTTSKGDIINLEWSKKLLRRVIIRPGVSREVRFHFQKAIKSFREGEKEYPAETSFKFINGHTVYLDRFEA